MSDTTAPTKATPLGITRLLALAQTFGSVKVEVRRRVNPVRRGGAERRDYYADAPTPAFYELTVQTEYSGAGLWSKLAGEAGAKGAMYLEPLVGKLLADAGYLNVNTRARSLTRLVQDLEAQVAKLTPDQLNQIEDAETAKLALDARVSARNGLASDANDLLARLDRVGTVAGLEPVAVALVSQAIRDQLGGILDGDD